MITFSAGKKIVSVVVLLLMSKTIMAQSHKATVAERWVKSKAWAPGLKLSLYADVNAVEFKRQYKANKATWDKAFAFLADSAKLASLAPGKYAVDGENAYAVITDAPSRMPDSAKWESHRKYTDLQYVIRGEEKIGVAPLAKASVTEPYNEAKDAAHYTATGTYYIATPKQFFLFFPGDVHRPSILVEGFTTVKKLVIKIKVAD